MGKGLRTGKEAVASDVRAGGGGEVSASWQKVGPKKKVNAL